MKHMYMYLLLTYRCMICSIKDNLTQAAVTTFIVANPVFNIMVYHDRNFVFCSHGI